jgi:hypothetical protein
MKTCITLLLAIAISTGTFSCKSDRKTSREDERREKSDTTYLENQDNNGQPTSDEEEGGTVTETEGAPESGYGSSSGSDDQQTPKK